jgi:hypothetical protein
MDEDIEKQIIERLAELPEDIRMAVESGDIPAHVHDIGAKHALHIDQIGLLEDATMLVMLGFTSPDDFTADIIAHLHIPSKDAGVIADEVSEQLFVPIRESMQKFMEKRSEETLMENPKENYTEAALPVQAEVEKHELPIPIAPPKPEPSAMPLVDTILTQKTISTPASSTAQTPVVTPKTYKTDPYREPPE